MAHTSTTPRPANPVESSVLALLPLQAQSTGTILEWHAIGTGIADSAVRGAYVSLKSLADLEEKASRPELIVH